MSGSPAFNNLATYPESDDFFDAVNYKGAFGYSNWALNWTALDDYGILSGGTVEVAEAEEIPVEFSLGQNFPNPFNPTTTISFQVLSAGTVKVNVYDILGRKVDTLVDNVLAPGTYAVSWNASDNASGTYFYTLEAGEVKLTRKMLLIK